MFDVILLFVVLDVVVGLVWLGLFCLCYYLYLLFTLFLVVY